MYYSLRHTVSIVKSALLTRFPNVFSLKLEAKPFQDAILGLFGIRDEQVVI